VDKLKQQQHWTANTIDDFVFQVASDFTLQLEKKLEVGPIKNKEFAERLDVTPGRVSQVFNNPGNFKLRSMAEYARALASKVAIVLYEDGDPENNRGPINSEVFYECWKRQGRPQDMYDLRCRLVVRPIRYGYSPMSAGTRVDEPTPGDLKLFTNTLEQAGTTRFLVH
jgi:hypothetical protein